MRKLPIGLHTPPKRDDIRMINRSSKGIFSNISGAMFGGFFTPPRAIVTLPPGNHTFHPNWRTLFINKRTGQLSGGNNA